MIESRLTRKELRELQKEYPPGTRIVLDSMVDPFPVESGARGTVEKVDGLGNIQTLWDNGRMLSVIPKVDSFRKLTEQELQEEQQSDLQEQGEPQWQIM